MDKRGKDLVSSHTLQTRLETPMNVYTERILRFRSK